MPPPAHINAAALAGRPHAALSKSSRLTSRARIILDPTSFSQSRLNLISKKTDSYILSPPLKGKLTAASPNSTHGALRLRHGETAPRESASSSLLTILLASSSLVQSTSESSAALFLSLPRQATNTSFPRAGNTTSPIFSLHLSDSLSPHARSRLQTSHNAQPLTHFSVICAPSSLNDALLNASIICIHRVPKLCSRSLALRRLWTVHEYRYSMILELWLEFSFSFPDFQLETTFDVALTAAAHHRFPHMARRPLSKCTFESIPQVARQASRCKLHNSRGALSLFAQGTIPTGPSMFCRNFFMIPPLAVSL
ncbi:hypothetical protein C8R45DRAFT_946561 [Mycena sanguinolenta]|nr:hypothetical protein C8R45DRAFT_946561 [Mycena sanguinolenta]